MHSEILRKHPLFTQAQSLNDICNPLRKFNIDHFCHVHINSQSEMTWLSQDPAFVKNYVAKEYYHTDIHGTNNNLGELILWNNLKYNGKTNTMLQDAVDFHHKQFFTIVEKDLSGTHFYHFATNNDSDFMTQVYLSNIDLLKTFIQYFNHTITHSKDFLNWQDFKLTISETPHDCFMLDGEKNRINQMRSEFISDISKNKINPFSLLSQQQEKCLRLLATGLSAKEIAIQLNISYRTVESYLARIREIVGCRNLKELLSLFFKYGTLLQQQDECK